MFASIGAMLAGLIGKKVGGTAAKAIGIVAAGVLLGSLLAIGKCAYDGRLISNYENGVQADLERGAREAEHEADRAEAARSEDFRTSQGGLDAAARTAEQADPEGAARPVGPSSQSYYDELRRQRRENSR